MYLKNINLNNFRNYDTLSLEFSKGINIIYGNNAQGKTNLLESIYVLGLVQTFRQSSLDDMLKKNTDIFKIKGQLHSLDGTCDMEIMYSNNNKKLSHDLRKILKINDYIKKTKIIVFSPEDLFLLKDSKMRRRKYFDIQISQLNNNYFRILKEYNDLLKIRNNILRKDNIDETYLKVLTKSLAQRIIVILKNRYKYIDYLNQYVEPIYYKLTGIHDLNIIYKSNINLEKLSSITCVDDLVKIIEENYTLEKKLHKTVIGPHIDDYEIYIQDNNIKNYGSQGQQRMALLAIKLAEIELFKEKIGEYPLLLLDDVFSELDCDKKNNLLNYIDFDIQTIITTTDLKYFNQDILGKSKLIEICNGKIIRGDIDGR